MIRNTIAQRTMEEILYSISVTGTVISMRGVGSMTIFSATGKNFYIEAVKGANQTEDSLSMSVGRGRVFVLNDVLDARCVSALVNSVVTLYKLQQRPKRSFEMCESVRKMKSLYDQSMAAKNVVADKYTGNTK